MRKPPALRPGDTIAVVSPASPVEPEKLKNGVRILEERGYVVRFGQYAFERNAHLAGTDEQRAADLQDAWFDNDIDGIICSRGGYGAARLVPLLDFEAMAQRPKLLAGFSDITILHLGLNNAGLATLHSPMLLSFVKDRSAWVVEQWFQAMEGRGPISLPPEAPRAETLEGGKAVGEVTGGCLCLLCDSILTEYSLDTSGKVVLIEDVDEAPHRVDAMLTHLLNIGMLQDAAGIVIGEMTSTDDKIDEGIGGRPWKEIVRERLCGLGIPIVTGFPFGHQFHMSSLPLGVEAELDADSGTLTYLELGVEPR